MRIICFIVLLMFACRLPAADLPAPMMDGAWSIGSNFQPADSMQFVSRISREQLARTPAWNPDSEFPPLSPRKAADLAQAMLHKIAAGRRWAQSDISLKPFDVATDEGDHRDVRWLYVLHYGLLNDVDNNQSGSLFILVLMDGTVIEPKPVTPKPVIPKPPIVNTNTPSVKTNVPAKPPGA